MGDLGLCELHKFSKNHYTLLFPFLLALFVRCGGGSVVVVWMYYSIHKKSASLQEFFLLAHFIRCGGDSFSFADFFVERME
ncbi:MAG: hypothetical protein PHO95_08660 [Bacteroidales bacterium]|jgi:hypothetical protein|nr:hypothetical protein [Bacteroidales bacterium]